MARIVVTGSTEGLGRAAAQTLIDQGHAVVLHARSTARAAALADLAPRALGVVVGDLSSMADTRGIAGQVNGLGAMDAVIHNAGLYSTPDRAPTAEGHAAILAVNTLAPYLLTAWIHRPRRLVYLSSGLHMGATADLDDIDWVRRRWNPGQAYAQSKLYVTALALAVARHWPAVSSHAVDPGWVPTRMGGPDAPDDLVEGHRTQVWLAAGDDPGIPAGGRYWHHRNARPPAADAADPAFQDRLLERLAGLTGVSLF